ncbi:glycosyltransferase [Microbacterium sediminicola]|uniref:Glycosyltransferase n=1 Tax=Microbacterium sediminicola TaxID=415210 RepID=A0ABN2IHA4_9MICO
MQLSVIVPTYNEAPNVAELVARISEATRDIQAEIVFVDDSTDATPEVITEVARTASLPVRLVHRDIATGGLGGAVVVGFDAATADVCIVMDGDLQHPPEDIPRLWDRYSRGDVDVVVASRYDGEGSNGGLSGVSRVAVSRTATALTKAMFPGKLRGVSDPMTGFFLVDRRVLDIPRLNPRGFKILLEILARSNARVAEVPFQFAGRHAGESKASARQGVWFLWHLALLRFGKMSLFAVIGALGAVANIVIVWALTRLGMDDIPAMVIAAETTIIGNFLLQERFVFQDVKQEASGVWSRFAKSFAFNNAEALVRIPLTAMLVSTWHISVVIATALTLALAFIARFLFHALVVYAPRRRKVSAANRDLLDKIDEQIMAPGEL